MLLQKIKHENIPKKKICLFVNLMTNVLKEIFFSFSICLDAWDILRTSTEHKTASLADEGSSAYCQSSGAHTIKHI